MIRIHHMIQFTHSLLQQLLQAVDVRSVPSFPLHHHAVSAQAGVGLRKINNAFTIRAVWSVLNECWLFTQIVLFIFDGVKAHLNSDRSGFPSKRTLVQLNSGVKAKWTKS